MRLITASEVISFVKKLEEDSAKFFKDLSQRYTKDGYIFLSIVKENKKNVIQIERTYYEVISDAIEGCFAFDINPDDYAFNTELQRNTSYSDALNQAVEMEKQIIKFYSDAAEQSKSLLADVPRAFAIIVKKRSSRIQKLRLILREERA